MLTQERGGDLMRFYTKQHQFYCGIDLHARTMSLCILNQEGEMLVHRNMPAGPDPFLKTIAPYREHLVVCVACICTWYWLADLCAREGIPFVLGHALSRKAIHGGKAKNDNIDAQKMAVLRRGGMLPQAYVSPAALRATRDLLRRRMHLMRKRAALRAHIQHTHRQYNLPEIGKQLAYKANRDGVAARFPDPALPSRASFCVLRPSGQMRAGISGEALWHLGHQDRQCLSHMGLFGSRCALFAGQACGPKVSG